MEVVNSVAGGAVNQPAGREQIEAVSNREPNSWNPAVGAFIDPDEHRDSNPVNSTSASTLCRNIYQPRNRGLSVEDLINRARRGRP